MKEFDMDLSRRAALILGGLGFSAAGKSALGAPMAASSSPMTVLDPVRTEMVMNLVVTCSKPERMGPSQDAPDGKRDDVWPIVGGRFWGPNIAGQVIPGGGDFPVLRPDGVEIIDALYRLRTDDGVEIIIHNKGMAYSETKYRLVPEFTVTKGKYDWLNRAIFVSTLVYPVPAPLQLASGSDQNDRLIQVHRIA